MNFPRQKFIGLTSALFLLCLISTAGSAQTNNLLEKTLNEAGEAVSANDLSRAKTLVRKLLIAAPRSVEAQTLAGVLADRQNDLPAAEKYFAVAARLEPKSSATRNNYGAILLRRGRIAEAAREFRASLAANPNQPSAQINLAQIYFDKGTTTDLRAARTLFENAFNIAPDIEVARALVITDLRLNETDLARKDFRQFAALAENSDSLPAARRVELGSSLLEKGLFAEAQSELDSALAVSPNDVETIVLLSRARLAQKEIKSAGMLLESAAARGIDDARIYAALGDVYTAGGFYENAIPAMRLAIERDKGNEEYRFRYGLLLVDTKAPAAAVIRLTESVKEFPRSARLWLALGIAQFNDSKTVEARQSVENALTFDARLVPAIAYLAAIEDETGKSVEAASNYERALALDGKNAALNYLLAEALLKNAASDIERIEKHLRLAIETDDSLAAAHLALGRLYARQKRFAEAAAELEKTVAFQPDRAEAYYQLGQIYVRLKRPDESRAALAKFKELSELEKKQTDAERRELVRRLANVKF